MRRILLLLLAGVFLLCGCAAPGNRDDQGVSPDAGDLTPAVTDTPEPAATAAVLVDPVELDFTNRGITDAQLAQMIEEGEIPSNVTKLILKRNQISDLSPLENLPNLEHINLDFNEISDLSPLESLTHLTFLRLDQNKISDLGPLKGLVNLTELHLWTNQITDLTPLKDLVGLTTLYLDHNQITDISPLQDLVNLEVLDLSQNEVADWSPVSHLKTVGGRP